MYHAIAGCTIPLDSRLETVKSLEEKSQIHVYLTNLGHAEFINCGVYSSLSPD